METRIMDAGWLARALLLANRGVERDDDEENGALQLLGFLMEAKLKEVNADFFKLVAWITEKRREAKTVVTLAPKVSRRK
jgi:hypothetical protein